MLIKAYVRITAGDAYISDISRTVKAMINRIISAPTKTSGSSLFSVSSVQRERRHAAPKMASAPPWKSTEPAEKISQCPPYSQF